MKIEYRNAFSEVYEIFQLMPKSLLNRIPRDFQEMIEEERNKSYYPNITEPLEKQKLKYETIIILGLIYRDFICSPEERHELQIKDARELQEIEEMFEKEKREIYNPDNVFKENKIEKIKIEEKKELIIVEEKWYTKLMDIIKKIFKFNK